MELGKYIVAEGSDGTGKSTLIEITQQRLARMGIKSIQIHEPDGFAGDESLGISAVPEATILRKRIKDATISRTPWQNVEWFTRSRELNWHAAMLPALKMGIWVLAARNYYSTITYQGDGEGISKEEIERITLERVGEHYANPDLAVILTLQDESVRLQRINARGSLDTPDTFESKPAAFQDAMQDGYTKLAIQKNLPIIDASASQQDVSDTFWRHITPLLPKSK